jgi:hypothetical protein
LRGRELQLDAVTLRLTNHRQSTRIEGPTVHAMSLVDIRLDRVPRELVPEEQFLRLVPGRQVDAERFVTRPDDVFLQGYGEVGVRRAALLRG